MDLHVLNVTHDPKAKSWLPSANRPDTDFPLQNLPFAIFRRKATQESFRGGVAIGDKVIDLGSLARSGVLSGVALAGASACSASELNAFFDLGPSAWSSLRHSLFQLFEASADSMSIAACSAALVPMEEVEYSVPASIGDYTDFFTSLHHALNAGRLFKPDDPLPPNFKWVPTAYHGRSSSIGVSGQLVRRPQGQSIALGESTPTLRPSGCLDYECEMGIFIGQGNPLGGTIPVHQADDHVFGMCLLNDWSARDIQFWEMAPLGPFQSKNFATTISPWIVTMEALAPFRLPWTRSQDDPQPLHYLEAPTNRKRGALDIQLEVLLSTSAQRDKGIAPSKLSRTSFRHQYWSVAQMVAHHSLGGCNLRSGDLLGSGTVSGPSPEEAGALLELTSFGRNPVVLEGGQTRGFLSDGDKVILQGWCESNNHVRIGFGQCEGTVLPANSLT